MEKDVVTYQAVRGYLQNYRGAEYERDTGDCAETVADAVQKLRGRFVKATETKLKQFRNTPPLTLGEFRVLVDVGVLCTECNSRHGIVKLLSEGGCNCPARRAK